MEGNVLFTVSKCLCIAGSLFDKNKTDSNYKLNCQITATIVIMITGSTIHIYNYIITINKYRTV